MSASTQSAAGRTSAARLRSAGGWPGAISPSRSLPGRWLTATVPNWSAQPARAWSSTRPPASRAWAVPEPAVTTWLEHAVAYADMKWPRLAPHSRASLADALATVTLALTRPASGRPPARHAARRVVPARLQPDPARYHDRSGRGTGARVAGAGLTARHPAQRPAGHPGRARCADAAAGRQPRRSEHHRPQAGSVPRRRRLRRRARPAPGQPGQPGAVDTHPKPPPR